MRNPVVEEDLDRILGLPLEWSAFEDATVLIAGGNGFIPAFLIETLLRLNEKRRCRPLHVIALVRDADRATARFAHYEGRGDLSFIVQDVAVPLVVSRRVDYIIHAASQASPKYYGKDPVGTLSANVLGAHGLLSLAREHQSKGFLFVSSGEVYGLVDAGALAIRESDFGPLDTMDVRACYAEGKRAAEALCACFAHQFGVPARVVRPFHTYGPGMRLDDGRVFADFVADILAGRDITLRSDGKDLRSFCYLADAAAGLFTVLLHGKNGEAYNVGNDQCCVSIGELASILAGLFPEKKLGVIRREDAPVPGYIRSRIRKSCPDTTKLRALGWAPAISIAEGFTRTISSFEQL